MVVNVSNLAVVIGMIATVLAILALVLVVRPLMAQQKLRIDGEEIRDLVMDAYLDGQIEATRSELNRFLYYCHLVEAHTNELRVGRALALQQAARRQGLKPPPEKVSADRILFDAKQRLDELVGDCLIHSSRAWWLLAPLRVLWRAVRYLLRLKTPHDASAYQLAVTLREEVSDEGIEAKAYRAVLSESGEHREDRDRELVPA